MKAAIVERYGPPGTVVLRDMPMPKSVGRDVLIRIEATTVSSGDCRVRGANFPRGFGPLARLGLGWTGPRQPILGTECAGTIAAVGPLVSRFRVGEEVFAFTGMKFGNHAEYIAVPEDSAVASKPAALSFGEAAAMSFGGATALYFLRDRARIRRGERILINGAGGSIGIAAVQIARHLGARVTAVCSAGKANRVKSLGAEVALDYRTDNFVASGERWDIVVDTVGNLTVRACRPVLSKGGRLILLASGLPELIAAPFRSAAGGFTVIAGTAPGRLSDLLALKEFCDAGAYRPVIDSCFAFDDIVAAHRRVEAGGKTGSVVVTVDS